MLKKITDIRHSKFSRNVALVFSGALIGQLLTFACSPILTRLYGPEAFGLMGTMLGIASVLAPLVTFAYPMAVTLPEHSGEAKRIVTISFFIAVLISLFSFPFVLLFKTQIAAIVGMQTNAGYLLLLPLMLFFFACVEISQQWMVRKHYFLLMTKVAVRHSFIVNFFKVAAGFLYPYGITLIVLSIIASLQQALMYTLKQIGFRQLFTKIRSELALQPLVETAVKYKDFPLYRMPQIFVLAISQNFPLLMLASYSGMISAGHYGLARTVMVMPVMLLGNAVGSVFYPRINHAVNKSENTAYFLKKATLALGVLSLLPFIFLFFFSPWLFSVVFGDEWRMAGNYASWLSLFFYFSILSKPALAAVAPLKLQKNIFYYELVSTILKLLVFLIGLFLLASEEKAVILFSVIGALSYLFVTLWVMSKSKKTALVDK